MKMKKIYLVPTMQVVRIQHQCHILEASNGNTIKSVESGDAELEYGGGGNGTEEYGGPARGRRSTWDDEDEEQ